MISRRTLSRSELQLSEIGLGCATLAFDARASALEESSRMLTSSLNSGINHYDTAPFYGKGISERLVGDALRSIESYVLSSKVGRLLQPSTTTENAMPFDVEFDYSYDGIMRSIEHSYQRLGLAKIDIIYAHDLGVHTHGNDAQKMTSQFIEEGGYRAMDELRKAGDVTAIGLGVNEIDICLQAMEFGEFDIFLLAGRHTLLENTQSLEYLNRCLDSGIDVIIGGPFNSGMLVGGNTYNYRDIPNEKLSQYKILSTYCQQHNVELGAAALQYPLLHEAVKSVIPGPKTAQELNQILDWYETEIPLEFWSGLQEATN